MTLVQKGMAVATVTDCAHRDYGRQVCVQAKSGTLRLVQPVNGGAQFLVSKIHLRVDDVGSQS